MNARVPCHMHHLAFTHGGGHQPFCLPGGGGLPAHPPPTLDPLAASVHVLHKKTGVNLVFNQKGTKEPRPPIHLHQPSLGCCEQRRARHQHQA